MPWHDPTAPASGDDVGDGDDQIRALKGKLNTDLENVAFVWDGASIHPVLGFCRTYNAALAAPPAPPAAQDTGRLWWVNDKFEVRLHDGTGWRAIQQRDVEVGFDHGLPMAADTLGAWADKGLAYWTGSAMAFSVWAANDGFRFSKDRVAYNSTIHFHAGVVRDTGTQVRVQLFENDLAGAGARPTSILTCVSTTVQDLESGDIAADLSAGEHRYKVQVETTGGAGRLHYCGLRIRRA